MGLFSGLLGNAGTINADKLAEEYGQILAQGESFEIGFVVIRDTFIFTDKRLILVDKQGITGRKAEYLSIPYGKITKFSVETAGHFDLDADLKIWVGSDPKPIEKEFNRKVNIYDVQAVLASHI
ncbi:PH domain-containing protein [Aliikangiella marina]|uniref:PH domain-containing protein n=1 Tax=Aliikangiella marina TaxID=1712262 RepID=A0A545T7E7_9GAMM|nr:PH domain-containing protein [Aliikangiella marina]TQV73147.1 PH domain-containing protein [Aliikangiella marina]